MPSPQYGTAHQRQRRLLLTRLRDGDPCGICHMPMYRGQPLDADHSVPVSAGGRLADRLTHRSCNRWWNNGTRNLTQPPPTRRPAPITEAKSPLRRSRDW